MLDQLHALLSPRLRRARQFSADVARQVQASPSLTMEHLREWLVSPGVAAQLADDGLLKLHASDAVLRRLAEDALGELLEASTQLAKTKLVLNNLAPFSTLLGETYQGRIVQATRDTNQNPAERRCIWQGVEALLYWHKVRFLCSFMKDQRQAALPWSEIRPHVEFIFDANAKRRAADAKSKQGLIALKQQLASLVLLSRSLSSGLHGRQALIAARIADHFAAHTLIGQGRAGSVTHGRGVNSTMVDATLPLLPTQPAVSVFYGLTKNVQALVKLEEDIKQTGALPEWLDGLTVPEVMMVTKQLKARWSGKQLKRRAERRAIDGRIAVVHGMAEIGEQLTPMRYKHPSRRDAISDEEKGALIDASAQGIGIKLMNHDGWLKAGQVLGVKIDGDPTWRIAVVRRAVLEGHRQMFAGLEWLGSRPERVKLLAQGASKAGEIDAVVLHMPGASEDRVLVLCMNDDVVAGERYRAEPLEGEVFHLRVGGEVALDCDSAVHFAQALKRQG